MRGTRLRDVIEKVPLVVDFIFKTEFHRQKSNMKIMLTVRNTQRDIFVFDIGMTRYIFFLITFSCSCHFVTLQRGIGGQK